jgi:hypothetical protein
MRRQNRALLRNLAKDAEIRAEEKEEALEKGLWRDF